MSNEIVDSAEWNVEVRGEKAEAAESAEEAAAKLAKKKEAYASLGMLVPVNKEAPPPAGLITDQSGATSVTLRKNVLRGGGGAAAGAAAACC